MGTTMDTRKVRLFRDILSQCDAVLQYDLQQQHWRVPAEPADPERSAFEEASYELFGDDYQVSSLPDLPQLREAREALLGNPHHHEWLSELMLRKTCLCGLPPQGRDPASLALHQLGRALCSVEDKKGLLLQAMATEGWHIWKEWSPLGTTIEFILCLGQESAHTRPQTENEQVVDAIQNLFHDEKKLKQVEQVILDHTTETQEPFHKAGKLPPVQERKEIVKKIRARTLSRASQQGEPSSSASELAQPEVASSPSSPHSSLLLLWAADGPRILILSRTPFELTPAPETESAKEPEEPESTAKSADKEDRTAITLDPEDTAWMQPDHPESKTSKKPKSKKKKNVQKKKQNLLTSQPESSEEETEGKAMKGKGPADTEAQNPAHPEGELQDDGNGEWIQAPASKLKKKVEAKEKEEAAKHVAHAKKMELQSGSGAVNKPKAGASGIAKPKGHALPKQKPSVDAEPKQEFRFQEAEFPDLHSTQTLSGKRSLATKTQSESGDHTPSKTEGAEYKALRVMSSSSNLGNQELSQSQSAVDSSATQSPDAATSIPIYQKKLPSTMKVDESAAAPSHLTSDSILSDSLEDNIPANVMDASQHAAATQEASGVPVISETAETSEDAHDAHADIADSLEDLAVTSAAESDGQTEQALKNDANSDNESFASDLTAVPDNEEAMGNVYGVEDRPYFGGNPYDDRPKLGMTGNPFADEAINTIGEWISDPGEITIDGVDAREVLGEQFPRGLTIQDHPDVNVFLHTDFSCAHCNKVIVDDHITVPSSSALLCRRCGPCSLIRYCSQACLVVHSMRHYEVCGGRMLGVFPLDWSSLPERYYEWLPFPDACQLTPEKLRQMNYVAELYENEIPHVRKMYFEKHIKTLPSSEIQPIRNHIATSNGQWNAAQLPGAYFIFIDNALYAEHLQTGDPPFKHGEYAWRRYCGNEGLCPATAITVQLPDHMRIPFNRLINACFLTNDPQLVEYLWAWIREELAHNPSVLQWCATHAFNPALLFLLWTHQFTREFGLSQDRQSALIEMTSYTYHPYAEFFTESWTEAMRRGSINGLIYEFELRYPLLRAWRRPEPRSYQFPRDPWARLRGDNFHQVTNSDGLVVSLNKQPIPWVAGWHGMFPYVWQDWLTTKHVVQVREALKQCVSDQEIAASLFSKQVAKDPHRHVMLRNGKPMKSLYGMRSGLKTLFSDVPQFTDKELLSQSKLTGGNVNDSANISEAPFVGGAGSSDGITTKPFATQAKKNNKSTLNPAVAEFRSLSPTKPTETMTPTTAGKAQPKPLATSAQADEWLATAGITIPNQSTSAVASAGTVTLLSEHDELIHGRWRTAEVAYCKLIRDEMAADDERARKVEDARFDRNITPRQLQEVMAAVDEELKMAMIREHAARTKVEGLRLVMHQTGSAQLLDRVAREVEQDRVESQRLMKDKDMQAAGAKLDAFIGGGVLLAAPAGPASSSGPSSSGPSSSGPSSSGPSNAPNHGNYKGKLGRGGRGGGGGNERGNHNGGNERGNHNGAGSERGNHQGGGTESGGHSNGNERGGNERGRGGHGGNQTARGKKKKN